MCSSSSLAETISTGIDRVREFDALFASVRLLHVEPAFLKQRRDQREVVVTVVCRQYGRHTRLLRCECPGAKLAPLPALRITCINRLSDLVTAQFCPPAPMRPAVFSAPGILRRA